MKCLRLGYGGVASMALVAVALTSSGCIWIAAGAAGGAAAGYAYCKGKVCGTYLAAFADASAATHTALAELGMPIRREEQQSGSGFIETCTADGERVRIYLEAQASKIPAEGEVTCICVRVATFGDRLVSERILDQVGFHLAPAPAASFPAATPSGGYGLEQTGAKAPGPALPQTAPPPLLPPEGRPAPANGGR